jgi:gliding motility-associated-like protein
MTMRNQCYSVLFLLLVFTSALHAQSGMWTWMHGSSIANDTGSKGTIGIPSPTNDPPGLYEACEWTDLNGNFWLYGGESVKGMEDNLWMFNPATKMWTLVKAGTQTVVTGMQGVAAMNNTPGPKGYGCLTWVDKAGDLWLFGGFGLGIVDSENDLWKYTIATNSWTWMGGTPFAFTPGVYGVMGQAGAGNWPSPRNESGLTWVDQQGNLWMFGGYISRSNPNTTTALNDLWKYDIGINQWTWMHGSDVPASAACVSGHYGTKGQAAGANDPPGRWECFAKFKDRAGNLWMLGGLNGKGTLNDLWKFDPAAGMWSWEDGSATPADTGNYGQQCIPANANQIPARAENRACWTDQQGNFYVYGGFDGYGLYNDLWCYKVSSREWVWLKGSNLPGEPVSTGIQGQPAPGNNPAGKMGSLAFTDQQGNFWLFGGTSKEGRMNDLWKYTPDSLCHAYVKAAFSDTSQNGCPALTYFSNTSIGTTSYSWNFGDGTTSLAHSNPVSHSYSSAGTYTVTLVASNGPHSDTSYQIAHALADSCTRAGFASDLQKACVPITITFANTSICARSCLWNFGDGSTSTSLQHTLTHQYTKPGFYTVSLNVSGPSGTDSVGIQQYCIVYNCIDGEVFIPNVFYPAEEGINSTFKVSVFEYAYFHLSIYDRWGREVFQSDDPLISWNGKLNNTGAEATAGTYYYVLNFHAPQQEQRIYKGFLSLIRP